MIPKNDIKLLFTYLVLVSRVEWDLRYFGVFLSHFLDCSAAQLNTFQQSRLGGVTGHISLEEEDGEVRTSIIATRFTCHKSH